MTSDLKDKELVFWTKSPNKFFVAKSKESGRIIGCASFKEMTPAKVELCRVAVDKEFRGLKIGENLLKFMIDLAKESGYNTMYSFRVAFVFLIFSDHGCINIVKQFQSV